ncbi:MAG: toll/interleukin-1 receptor domain-containing protein [Pseudomonadota bacterium]
MGYLPDRDFDVFISYAHDDDGASGWVSDFSTFLADELGKQLRVREGLSEAPAVAIWKDHKLPRHGALEKRLADAVSGASTLIVVMSPYYLNSRWCRKEGEAFVRSLQDEADMRIFIVEKERTDRNNWPDFLKDETSNPLLSYEFFERTELDEFAFVPMRTPHGSIDPRAERRLARMGKDYSEQLYNLKHHPQPKASGAQDTLRSVYFGLCQGKTADKARTWVVDVLNNNDKNGIHAGPGADVKIGGHLQSSLDQDLASCVLFVQVLDQNEGVFGFDHELGMVGVQRDEALAKGVPILYWLVPEMDPQKLEKGAYQDFLLSLASSKGDGSGLVEGNREALVDAVESFVSSLSDKDPSPGPRGVCFVAVRSDKDDSEMVSRFNELVSEVPSKYKITVIQPTEHLSSEDIASLDEYAKGLVIVWGKVALRWVMDEIDTFMNRPDSDDKCAIVAIFDPPKGKMFLSAGDRLKPIDLTEGADNEETFKEISSFVDRLGTLMDKTEGTVH